MSAPSRTATASRNASTIGRGFACFYNQSYDLFVEKGTAGFYILELETGIRDTDLFRNKKMCPAIGALEHRHRPSHHFVDQVKFHCRIGFVLVGSENDPVHGR